VVYWEKYVKSLCDGMDSIAHNSESMGGKNERECMRKETVVLPCASRYSVRRQKKKALAVSRLRKKHSGAAEVNVSTGLHRVVRMMRTERAETHTELHTERVAIFSHTAAVKVKRNAGTQLSDPASTPLTLPLVPSESCCELLISGQSDHK